MQESRNQTADARDSNRQQTPGTLYQTVDARDSLSDIGCKRLFLTDSGCRSRYIRQRMQDNLYQTADARYSKSDSECRSLYIRQRMQETHYQTADAGVSI